MCALPSMQGVCIWGTGAANQPSETLEYETHGARGGIPKLRLTNKILEPSPRSAREASGHSRTPRANGNKISARSNRSEDSQNNAPKSSPGKRVSPRGEPRSPRAAFNHLASMADIKAELLGLDMRRLVREELRSVLSECRSAGGEAAAPIEPFSREYEPHHHTVPEDAEDILRLQTGQETLGSDHGDTIDRKVRRVSLTLDTNVLSMLEAAAQDTVTSWDRHMLRLQHALSLVGTRHPPLRTDFLSRIADSLVFDLAVHIVIVFNVICMAVEADYDIMTTSRDLELHFRILEAFFVLFYAFEFVIKFARSRWLYFYGSGFGWNWVDFIVLVFSIPFALQIDGAMEALPAKIIRILRLSRALRVMQLVTFFKKLRALMHSLAASVSTLACSVGLLLVFLFMFSLFFVMRVGQVLQDPLSSVTSTQKDALLQSFGGIVPCMLTLYQACSGGSDWSDIYVVIKQAGWESQIVFIGFIVFSQLALLNIVLGMFVEQAMKSMASDKLEVAHRHFEEQKEFKHTIQELFQNAGMRNTERVTLEEWRACSRKHRLYSFLDFHGFQPNEVDQYFEMLSRSADGGPVDLDSFVNGCIRMKGGASSFAVYEVLLAVSELQEKLQAHLDQARP